MTPDDDRFEWTCPNCGIKHTERPTDDIATLFPVSDEWIEQMDWNRYCNCGFWELYIAALYGGVSLPAAHAKALDSETNRRGLPRSVKDQIIP